MRRRRIRIFARKIFNRLAAAVSSYDARAGCPRDGRQDAGATERNQIP